MGYRLPLMADERRFDLDDLLLRPGCYLNPQTEIMVVVDDSPSIDGEIFNMEEFEGADWVLIADEVPVDEARRDELLETFQATYSGGDGRTREIRAATEDDEDDYVDDDENAPPEADEDPEEL
jgi:hypothetical protein